MQIMEGLRRINAPLRRGEPGVFHERVRVVGQVTMDRALLWTCTDGRNPAAPGSPGYQMDAGCFALMCTAGYRSWMP